MCIPEIKAALLRLVPQVQHAQFCVAYSGGVDSTALLYAMSELRRELAPISLRAVHVNHHLLPQADEWVQHCRQVAERLRLALTVADVSVELGAGVSPEAAARQARYTALAAQLHSGEYLLTAHHQEDQLETILLQLMRGAGLAGLAAMPQDTPFGRGRHLRPLLEISRPALERLVRSSGLQWVEDSSNAALKFDRNYIRHRVLPILRERWPAAAVTAVRTGKHISEAQQLLNELAIIDLGAAERDGGLRVSALRAISPARARNLLRYWIRRAGARPPSTIKLQEILRQTLQSRADATPRVQWDNVQVVRRRGALYLNRTDRPPAT